MGTEIDLTPRQMALVRRTIASDCNDNEFNLFIEAAKRYRLDPFRKQIMPLVFSKNDERRRKMSIVTGRDGYRVIAGRCGNYRPASEKAEVEADEALKGPTNPKGLISVTVRVFTQDNRGDWHPVIGEALWDEFAPLKKRWSEHPQTGKRFQTDELELDASGNWARMPVLMLTKCAEAQAMRAGWPEEFGGLYDPAEMDSALAQDVMATEAIQIQEEQNRQDRIHAGTTILATFGNGVIDRVPVGEFADRVLEHIRALDPTGVHAWGVANREALNEFWARQPGDALELKKEIEKREEGFAELGAA